MTIPVEQLQALNACAAAVSAGIENGKAYFSPHAVEKMAERGITVDDIAETIKDGFQEKCDILGRISYATNKYTVIVQLENNGKVCIVTAYPANATPTRYTAPCLRKRALNTAKSAAYLRAVEDLLHE